MRDYQLAGQYLREVGILLCRVQGSLTIFVVKGACWRPYFVVVSDRRKSKPALLEWKKWLILFSEQAAP
jgi:hypothetical protein